MNDKTFIIAEAGANHNRNIEQAKKLIDIAKSSKADAVKFQTYSSETLYAKNTPNFAGYTNLNKLIKDIELPREWQKELKSYCDEKNIEFMSTPFDELAVKELIDIGVKRLKIAGFESTDPRFVKMVASSGLPLIVTSGIGGTLEKINDTLTWIRSVNKDADITILHGNNAYPTPYCDSNLRQITEIINKYPDIKVGFSDHTEGILMAPVAVALGAKVVEKHFTLSRKLPGPDHPFAIEPEELEQMIFNIRIVENSINKKSSEFSNSEKSFTRGMRSVVAKTDIQEGTVIEEHMITTMRPLIEDSIPAIKYYDILGSKTNKFIQKDTLLFFRDFV